jgi:hypothetical protein
MSPFALLASVLRSAGVLPFLSVELGQHAYQCCLLLPSSISCFDENHLGHFWWIKKVSAYLGHIYLM